jgi:hypothetical protein
MTLALPLIFQTCDLEIFSPQSMLMLIELDCIQAHQNGAIYPFNSDISTDFSFQFRFSRATLHSHQEQNGNQVIIIVEKNVPEFFVLFGDFSSFRILV